MRTAAENLVRVLTALAADLHRLSRTASSRDSRDAYADCALRVDQVNIGPAFQSVLDSMDAATHTHDGVRKGYEIHPRGQV